MSVRVLTGDCRDLLATLEAGSVQTCVTSPPYFGLRDYGVSGQIGLEPTPDAFVAELVAVFREVRRVLRDDGTLWLNLGDSYAGSWGAQSREHAGKHAPNVSAISAAQVRAAQYRASGTGSLGRTPGLKAKDLIGIPWRVAFALQADGWWLRSDIIWHKPNPMPESVIDRPTKAHEYVFLLTKSERYLYDGDAIREPLSPDRDASRKANANGVGARARSGNKERKPASARGVPVDTQGSTNGAVAGSVPWEDDGTGRNKRSVWTVPVQPFNGAHFATFPPALIEPCVLAGSAKQACETCGAPWARVVERESPPDYGIGGKVALPGAPGHRYAGGPPGNGLGVQPTRTLGFRPTCACETNTGSARSVVLDPFGGAGTTGLVADRLGRDAILCELNPTYADLARRRIADDAPLFGDVA